jgi:hypothetical protein
MTAAGVTGGGECDRRVSANNEATLKLLIRDVFVSLLFTEVTVGLVMVRVRMGRTVIFVDFCIDNAYNFHNNPKCINKLLILAIILRSLPNPTMYFSLTLAL